MNKKYIFVTGGVVSGLGKGITAASLGRLLRSRGLKVTVQKLDPYLNVDPGTMNPVQHGEVFVTDDGAETDLDLGHYERFIDISLGKSSNLTSGKVYWKVLSDERKGVYGGQTIQVIPHITNEIKKFIGSTPDADVCIVEIGGTIGDIEGQPFIEAIRQFSTDIGRENCLFIHVTLVPYIKASQELKTKPTQHSVKELLAIGIRPDVIVCRTDYPLDDSIKSKIALFCNVDKDCVIQNMDCNILYEVPIMMEKEGLAKVAIRKLGLKCHEPHLDNWNDMLYKLNHLSRETEIAIVGKYVALHDSYISVVEALKAGGMSCNSKVNIRWVDSEDVEKEGAEKMLAGIDGILVPGGFGSRGIEGKIQAAKYARENNIPYFGICLGMQTAMIEFARDVLGFEDANTSEINPKSQHKVIDLMIEQRSITDMGGTMRLGAYPCVLNENSKAYKLYGRMEIAERHRHRYEVNNEFVPDFEKAGVEFSGKSPDGRICEMIEIPAHRYFVACQFHPEFKSRPNHPHPLFKGFVAAASDYRESK